MMGAPILNYKDPIFHREQNYGRPPLRVDSTLRIASGITLTLSRQQQQVETGKQFFEIFREFKEENRSDRQG